MDLRYLKVDNLFQYFPKNTSDTFFILLGDKCLREIFKSFCELFQALIVLKMTEFFPKWED